MFIRLIREENVTICLREYKLLLLKLLERLMHTRGIASNASTPRGISKEKHNYAI